MPRTVSPSPISWPNFVASTNAVAPPLEHLAEEALAVALVAVDVGRVEEVDARFERGVDHAPGPREVDPAAEIVAAQPDDGDLDAALSQAAVLHD